MNDMGHDVFFTRSDRNIKTYAYHESSGTKLELRLRVSSRTCSAQLECLEEQHSRSVFFTFCF